jgi:DNA-binding response OmpR family regulator
MKILVIDKNESIRQDLKVTLEGEGYEVLTAGAGREGLEIFALTSMVSRCSKGLRSRILMCKS